MPHVAAVDTVVRGDVDADASRAVVQCDRGGGGVHQAIANVTSAYIAPSGDGNDDPSLIQQAAALRMKYKIHSALMRIPVFQIGSHPANRDGQGPSGSRTSQLIGDILSMGFDQVEADSNGVLVQQKPGRTHIHDANASFAEGDPMLAPVRPGDVQFGTLSHSTLSQALRNIEARCPATLAVAGDVEQPVPAALSRIVDTQGKFSAELLQQVDPAFAGAVRVGLLWEILSHNIETENPGACTLIQAALNAKNGAFLVCHEMQALSALMSMTASSLVKERHRSWEEAQHKMQKTMPQFANDAHFIDLFAFMMDMGGDQSTFLVDLKTFHTKFVNPQVRRLKLEVFSLLSFLPLDMPHLKIAALKYTYGSDRFIVSGKLVFLE